MNAILEPYASDLCCLCGSSGPLTGEHKIKASALRAIFKPGSMFIGAFDGSGPPKTAQGPKSKAFHFTARMCAPCNGCQTQQADMEFDRFYRDILALCEEGREPGQVFDLPRYTLGSEAYLNVFRYLAKLLCCQIAESQGPRLPAVRDFALGDTSRNVIHLNIDFDPLYRAGAVLLGEHGFAGHGGLAVLGDELERLPSVLQSSLTLGAIRFVFSIRFDQGVVDEIRRVSPEFWDKCEAAYQKAVNGPNTGPLSSP